MLFEKQVLAVLAAQSIAFSAFGFVAPTPFLGKCPSQQKWAGPLFSDVVSAVSSTAEDEAAESANEEVEVASAEELEIDSDEELEVASVEDPEMVATEDEPESQAAEEATPEEKERITIFVGNLPFQTTENEIRDIFTEYGTVELVSVPRNRETGQSRGFAFVDMATREELDKAVEGVNGMMFGGRTIRAAESLPKDQVKKPKDFSPDEGVKKIYVGNLPFETDKDSLVEFYSQYGTVKDVYIPLDMATGRARGFAFVTMDEADADNAIAETNEAMFMGRTLVVREPLPRGQKAAPRSTYFKRTKLYVGNLSFYTTLETVQEFFEEFGTVHDCYMPEDRETGESRGFAFVSMDSEGAETAIDEADGYELDGRIIRVNEAQPKGRSKRDDSYIDQDEGFGEEQYEGDNEVQESNGY